MRSFSQYVEEMNKGGYIAIKPTVKYAKLLEIACLGIGLDNCIKADDLHVTIFYDKREPMIPEYEPLVDNYKALIVQPALYKDALVLELSCAKLDERFNTLRVMGFKSDYDSYKPHISLKYNATGEDLALLQQKFVLFQMINNIDLDFEFSSPIKK